jgi:hypothetical protein
MTNWVDIVGFEGFYQISDEGEVKSLRNNLILKTSDDNKGYPAIRLSINGKLTRKRLHRIVAEHFIPNPAKKPEVNHIDGDKHNNNINNLEWVTHLENIRHAHVTGLTTNMASKAIQMLDKDGTLIREFYSLHEAERDTGAEPSNIVKVCKGKRKTTNGYYWRYDNGES